jgi:hypothetical protein
MFPPYILYNNKLPKIAGRGILPKIPINTLGVFSGINSK